MTIASIRWAYAAALLAACSAAPSVDTGEATGTDLGTDSSSEPGTDSEPGTEVPPEVQCDRWFPVTHTGASWTRATLEGQSYAGSSVDIATGPSSYEGQSTWVVTHSGHYEGFTDYTETRHYICNDAGVALLAEEYLAATGFTSSSVFSPPLLVAPATLAPGDRLVREVSLHFIDSGGAASDFGVSTSIEVVGPETLTTPAGTFDALKLVVDGADTWVVEGVGVVQSSQEWLTAVSGL